MNASALQEMTLLPQHPASRIAAALWLLACLALLAMTLLQHDLYANERSALAMMVPIYFLGFPSAHIALLIIARIKLALYMNAGFEPAILFECLSLWTLTVVLGYVQWFVLLPWLARKCRQFSGMLFEQNRR
jgi:hypothetical protein